jgi:hypothetical protein
LGVELEKIPPKPRKKANLNGIDLQDRICDISKKHRSIGNNWSLKNEELQRVIDSLYANQLLVDCLNVAIVSKRQAILDNLYTLIRLIEKVQMSIFHRVGFEQKREILIEAALHQDAPNTACTRLVGVCAFLGTLRGLKWVPSKWRCLVSPTSG